MDIELAPGTEGGLGQPILTAVSVDSQVDEILRGTVSIAGMPTPFGTAATELASAYREDIRWTPNPSTACGGCEFKAAKPPAVGELQSGFHECWKDAYGWSDSSFDGGTVIKANVASSSSSGFPATVQMLIQPYPCIPGASHATSLYTSFSVFSLQGIMLRQLTQKWRMMREVDRQPGKRSLLY